MAATECGVNSAAKQLAVMAASNISEANIKEAAGGSVAKLKNQTLESVASGISERNGNVAGKALASG